MRSRSFALLAFPAAFLLGACSSDLFHDTGWPTLCDREPEACAGAAQDGGDEDGASDAGTDSSGDGALDVSPDAPASDAADAAGGG